jgi:predicted dithiol-disulfide oxidoreductase (DUF899 family)
MVGSPIKLGQAGDRADPAVLHRSTGVRRPPVDRCVQPRPRVALSISFIAIICSPAGRWFAHEPLARHVAAGLSPQLAARPGRCTVGVIAGRGVHHAAGPAGLAQGRTRDLGGTMAVAFPGESGEYRAARNLLLEQEIELRRAMEAVAEARRRLPPGGVVPEDYVFQAHGPDGTPARVRLPELFAPGTNSLVIYSMMFPRAADDDSPGPPGGQTALLPLGEGPCPSCTALLDQLDGAAEHVGQHLNFAVAAKAPLERLVTFAAERGWRRLRLLSSAGTTYNRDYLAETADGGQQPMLNVFHRDGETIRHFWGSELFYAPADPGQEPRHVGTIEPLWNLFDFTREGRPANWHEQFSY